MLLRPIKSLRQWLASKLSEDDASHSDIDKVRQVLRRCRGHYGSNLVSLPDFYFNNGLTHYMWDDFDTYVDTQLWTKLAGDAGATVTNVDNTNGWLTLTTAAVANNEASVFSTRKNWKVLNKQPLIYEARINFVEANVNQAAIAFGFSSTGATADLLLDTTGLPAASFSGALIYTNPGDAFWRCCSSVGTVQTIQKSTVTAGSTTDQRLKIEIRMVSSTVAEVTFYLNGILMLDTAQTKATPIKQTMTYASAAAMAFGAYAKSIDGTGEVVNVDYMFAGQLRGGQVGN